MISRKGFLLAGLVVAMFAFGCGGDGSTLGPDGVPLADNDGNGDTHGAEGDGGDNGADEPAITLARLSADIFTPNCVSCHAGVSPSGDMNLSAAVIAANIIGVDSVRDVDIKRVAPGDPDASLLYIAVSGSSAGSQMPPVGATLSADEIAMIRDWIAAGAPAE